jgi:hypothetical protein
MGLVALTACGRPADPSDRTARSFENLAAGSTSQDITLETWQAFEAFGLEADAGRAADDVGSGTTDARK